MANKKGQVDTFKESLSSYRKQQPKLTETFKRAHRIINEHILRHEEALFKGEQAGKWNASLAKQGEELVKSLNAVGTMYLKIQEATKKVAQAMSFEEKLEAYTNWIEFGLGANQRKQVVRAMRELDFKLYGSKKD